LKDAYSSRGFISANLQGIMKNRRNTIMSQITVGEHTIGVVRKSIKNIHLRVYPPDGKVRVTAPLLLDDESIRRFVRSKQAWIEKHTEQFRTQERFAEKQYITGEIHYLAGVKYLLNVIPDSPYSHISLRDNAYIDLYVKTGSDAEHRKELLTEWYRAMLKARIEPLLCKWQRVMGVQAKEWSVKQMKTKWGTCNITAKRIWINLELAKKPERCLEYIIVHELLHLIEKSHNAVFKAHMDALLPDWKERKKELLFQSKD